jgi:hypothetical protein
MTPTNTTTPTNTQTPTNTITATPTVTPTPTRSYYLYVVDAYDCNSGPTCTPSATSQILFDQNNSGILSNGSYYTDNGDTGGQVFNILSQYLGSSGPNYVTYVIHTPYGSCDAACSALFPPTPTPTPTQTPTPTNTVYTLTVRGNNPKNDTAFGVIISYNTDGSGTFTEAFYPAISSCETLGTLQILAGTTVYFACAGTPTGGGTQDFVQYRAIDNTTCPTTGTLYCQTSNLVATGYYVTVNSDMTVCFGPTLSSGELIIC